MVDAAYLRAWKAANPDKVREYALRSRAKRVEKDAAYAKRWGKTPAGRYSQHKANSRRRSIPFLLTFAEWWALWEPYWYTSRRGHVMARYGDTGPYAVGNVSIVTRAENALSGETWHNRRKYGK